ncbi:unnamed protein product [Darwinula stevensoni]|uniref:RRM domain-containing protein n=1 Tax=Darwinula stevensoni TaxID=69355 RepID=A0A7R9FQ87_9CRUS|nr:unnamed protein product [Darwinula stevensoni]CAG0899258.1 unnamed protein product [Darwinula stevensoni]
MTVYVGNLARGTSKYDLEDVFRKYGPMKNVWVARSPPGFAFVQFEDPRDAEDAVRGLDGMRLRGNRIRVEMSHGRRRGDSPASRRDRYDSPYRGARKRSSPIGDLCQTLEGGEDFSLIKWKWIREALDSIPTTLSLLWANEISISISTNEEVITFTQPFAKAISLLWQQVSFQITTSQQVSFQIPTPKDEI